VRLARLSFSSIVIQYGLKGLAAGGDVAQRKGHGLTRCRYVGLMRYGLQVFLTVITLNLKRLVKLLNGANFKGRARLAT